MKSSAAALVLDSPRRVDVPGTEDTLDLSTMGGRMAWARLRKKMTQLDVANLTSKSRATIVQYEKDNINPPVKEVQKIATALGVSPEFLAFGRHGVEGLINAAEEVITVPEISEGRDGIYTSGGFAVPRRVFDSRNLDVAKVRMYVLNQEQPAFGYHAEDRLIVDTTVGELQQGYDIYLLKGDDGLAVVRREPNFGGGAKGMVTVTSGSGATHQVKAKGLDIVGAVVGKFSLSA